MSQLRAYESAMWSAFLAPTAKVARPPIGKVMRGSVWPKSTLASTGRPARRSYRAMICSSNDRVTRLASWKRPMTRPCTPLASGSCSKEARFRANSLASER